MYSIDEVLYKLVRTPFRKDIEKWLSNSMMEFYLYWRTICHHCMYTTSMLYRLTSKQWEKWFYFIMYSIVENSYLNFI